MDEWPEHWKTVADEAEDEELQRVWQYWRELNPHIAETATEELKRELHPSNPLSGAEFALIAWDSCGWKEFLFETTIDKAPVIMAHLTFEMVPNAFDPFILAFRDVADFIEQQRDWRAKHRKPINEDEPQADTTPAKPNALLPLLSMSRIVRRSNNSID